MDRRTLEDAPRNQRGGQTSHLLLGLADHARASITWIEAPRGSRQPLHTHDTQEQVYVVVRGTGRMQVGEDQADVGPGTCIRVPAGSPHAIEGRSAEPLAVVTITVPPFDDAQLGPAFAYVPPH